MRIGIFIDGSFLEVVRYAFHFDTKEEITLGKFVEIVKSGVARSYGIPSGQVDVLGKHWFRGEFPKGRGNKSRHEEPRALEDRNNREQGLLKELEVARITPHRRTMMQQAACRACGKPEFCEKGIDTLILADALEFADKCRPEAVVLVGSDGDHITLLERMEKRGIDTVLVYYDSPEGRKDDNPHSDDNPDTKAPPYTKTHYWLTDPKRPTRLLKIDWRHGFALLTQADRARMEREEEMKRTWVYRHFQESSESRQIPGVPSKRSS
jgi:hypothetical protein